MDGHRNVREKEETKREILMRESNEEKRNWN
jgi:hypothetical protein